MNEVRTTAQARAPGDLQWPERFAQLKAEQQSGARMALQQVDAALRQAVLDEWASRCASQHVRNPAGYLFGIIQRAIRGEFNAWVGRSGAVPSATAPLHDAIQPELVREHLDRLRTLLHRT